MKKGGAPRGNRNATKDIGVSLVVRFSYSRAEHAELKKAFELEPDGSSSLEQWIAAQARYAPVIVAKQAIANEEDAEEVRQVLAELVAKGKKEGSTNA